MATEFKDTVEKAVQDKKIAGGAAIAVNHEGKVLFKHAFGKTSLEHDSKPFGFDTTFWIASSTKLYTSISALQCVQKGLLNPDEDISVHIPHWKEPQILTGFEEDGTPKLTPAKEKITLRRLLTHSSGMSYAGMNPMLDQWRKYNNLTMDGTIDDHTNPLLFEPGSSWTYGGGIDWAGQLVEKVSGLKLGDYMAENIFKPLGLTSTTFDPVGNDAVTSRMVGRVGRNPTGELIKEESDQFPVHNTSCHFGGSGLYSTADDYIKVLTSLLLNDGKLLGAEMHRELFRGQLENPAAFAAAANHGIFGAFFTPSFGGYRTEDATWDYGLGGAVVNKEIPGLASKGTLFWSGLPNNYWFVDSENGVAGYYASWLLPPGDEITGKMFQALERAAVKEGSKL